jgi:hypothetical protein
MADRRRDSHGGKRGDATQRGKDPGHPDQRGHHPKQPKAGAAKTVGKAREAVSGPIGDRDEMENRNE